MRYYQMFSVNKKYRSFKKEKTMKKIGKTICIPCGPRGAGKTNFANKVIQEHPEILYLNQDELCKEEFGTVLLPVTYMMEFSEILGRRIMKMICESSDDAKIIIDINAPDSNTRRGIVQYLRSLGADFIVCWHFITSYEQCLKWFAQKTASEKGTTNTSAFNKEYEQYHLNATDINVSNSTFFRGENPLRVNMIRRVNPLNTEFSFP
jgi:hypothetical protein